MIVYVKVGGFSGGNKEIKVIDYKLLSDTIEKEQ